MNESVQHSLSIWTLVLDAGIVVQIVLVLLLSLSVLSWALIFNKWRTYAAAKQQDKVFIDLFWSGAEMQTLLEKAKTLKQSSQAAVFNKGFREYLRLRQNHAKADTTKNTAAMSVLSVRHAIEAEWTQQLDEHSKGLSFLATVGSTAPFIGLFGTVWGIIDAFQSIGISQNTSLATVAPGIAEALVATAFGLLAAIPAVMAYNAFSSHMKKLNSKLDGFATEFLNILTSHAKK